MALISKIRQRTGLAVGVVAAGILFFILGDLFFRPGGMMGGQERDNTVGVINGTEITYQEYEKMVDEQRRNYMMSNQSNPGEDIMPRIRESAWEQLIFETLYKSEFQKIGLEITEEELIDMVQGEHIHPRIKKAFTNPETGEFNKQQLAKFLQGLQRPPQDQQQQRVWQRQKRMWQNIEKRLPKLRLRTKYQKLLSQSTYITNAEASTNYKAKNSNASGELLHAPFHIIPDSAVSVTESAMEKYYNNHKESFRQEASRSFQYITFPFKPSSEDTAQVVKSMEKLTEPFKKAENDSSFLTTQSDKFLPIEYKSPKEIAPLEPSTLREDSIYGPYPGEDYMKLSKVTEVKDSIPFAKAQHILLKTKGKNEDSVQARAQKLISKLQQGKDFSAMARKHSEDPGSGKKGGNLGWFKEKDMVTPFSKAVFAANEPGLITQPVKSRFGYHIIKVNQTPVSTWFKLATVTREILPGQETQNEAFQQANTFAGKATTLEEFRKLAKKDTSLSIKSANKINPNAYQVNDLKGARKVVQWAFRDASVGDVSNPLDINNQYVIAALTQKQEKGIAPFSSVKDQCRVKARIEQKGKKLVNQINNMEAGSLDKIAEQLGDNAQVKTFSNLKLSSSSIADIGNDPVAVGKVFTLEEGETSSAFKGENGAYKIKCKNKQLPDSPENLQAQKQQLKRRQTMRISRTINEALKDAVTIHDYRYKFY